METEENLVSIFCPRHPSELVQRVSLDKSGHFQEIYCFECLIRPDLGVSPSDLITIQDFIGLTAFQYAQNKPIISPGAQIPPEYQTLLQGQNHHLESLSAYLEEEKIKIEVIFNRITEETLALIDQKKVEFLNSLDQQVLNLRDWYISFANLVKKIHPTNEDLPYLSSLFPSKEELIKRVQQIADANQLTQFVWNTKKDLNDKSDEARRIDERVLSKLYKELEDMKTERPQFQDANLVIPSFRKKTNRFLSEQIGQLFVMTNNIPSFEKNVDDSISLGYKFFQSLLNKKTRSLPIPNMLKDILNYIVEHVENQTVNYSPHVKLDDVVHYLSKEGIIEVDREVTESRYRIIRPAKVKDEAALRNYLYQYYKEMVADRKLNQASNISKKW